uniref:Branched-chain-amino-acid aminotransferase n=1 Tax=Arundo donax TaxID=35708 RepID=A0A0A9ETC0_ARUDO
MVGCLELFPHAATLIYCYCPSFLILGQPHLNGCQSRVQLLRHRVWACPEFVPLPLVSNCRHRRNHHRRPGAEHLVRIHQVVDGNEAFFNLVSAVPGELDDALARDPREDGAHGGGRGDDAALDDEHVARGHLLQVPPVDRVEVQHVREPLALGVHLRLEHRSVVGDRLDPAGAAGHRAVDAVLDHQVYRR